MHLHSHMLTNMLIHTPLCLLKKIKLAMSKGDLGGKKEERKEKSPLLC